MQAITEELCRTVEAAYLRLSKLTEAEAETPRAEGKWSAKQLLGHLVDSASNNHQRFVRAQLSEDLSLPGYEQEQWVESQHYQQENWEAMVALWRSYNLHLAHVISFIPESKVTNLCRVGASEPVTLGYLAEDYVRHLNHHLQQILD